MTTPSPLARLQAESQAIPDVPPNGAEAAAEPQGEWVATRGVLDVPPEAGSFAAPPPVAAPPKPTAKKPPPFKQPAAQRGALDQIIPTAESVKVYKVSDIGKIQLIDTFTAKEIVGRWGDIELFIKKKLVPTYGHGDYDVAYVNSAGAETRRVTIGIAAPTEAATADVGQNALASAFNTLVGKLDRLEAQKPVNNDTTTVQQLMADQARQREMDALKSELREMRREMQQAALVPPPMPPPAPKSEWTPTTVIALVSGLATTLAPLFGKVFDKSGEKEAQRKLEEAERKAREAELKRIEEIANRAHATAPADPISSALSGLARIDEFAQQRLQRMQPPPEDEGVGGMIKSVAQSLGAIESIADRIRARQQPARLPAKRQPANDNAEAAEAQPQPANDNGAVADKEAELEALCEAIEDAADDAARIEAAYHVLQWMEVNGGDDWAKRCRRMLKLAKRGDKAKSVEFVKATLTGLSDGGMLTTQAAEATVKAFAENFESVQALLAMQDGQEAAAEGAGEAQAS